LWTVGSAPALQGGLQPRLRYISSGSIPSSVPPGSVARAIRNPPQCHLGVLQKTLHPSKGNTWLSSTLTRLCSDGLPPKPICSDTSASAPFGSPKWCSPSNERDWFDDSLESLAASKCWLLPSCSRFYVDSISTDQNRCETCRRLNIPIRDYLGSVLPGLADRPISQTTELTPAAWANRK
jgi:hypothetical protein